MIEGIKFKTSELYKASSFNRSVILRVCSMGMAFEPFEQLYVIFEDVQTHRRYCANVGPCGTWAKIDFDPGDVNNCDIIDSRNKIAHAVGGARNENHNS